MELSHTMRAIEITEPGGPDVLQPCTRPVPVPGHGQIIIRVAYAGVNRPDALQRAGNYAPPANASPLPGLEASGTVVEIGPGVTRYSIGDKVCALLPGGGYAEYVATQETHALPIPDGVSPEGSRLPAGNLLHRLVQCGDARGPARRANASLCMAGHPASAPPPSRSPRRWARGCSPPPDPMKNAPPAKGWARKRR